MGSTGARILFSTLYYVLPNLANYSYITPIAHGEIPAARFAAAVVLYAFIYIVVVLSIATLIFRQRNFK